MFSNYCIVSNVIPQGNHNDGWPCSNPPLLLVIFYRKVIKTIEVKYIVINDIPQGNHKANIQ